MPYLDLDLPLTLAPAGRAEIATGLAHTCFLEDALGRPRRRTILEFTEHAGDDVRRSTGLGTEWSPAEAGAA